MARARLRGGHYRNRDKASLDIFWLRDESLEDSDNLPDPDVLAQEIVVPRLALRTISKPPSNSSAKSRMTEAGPAFLAWATRL